MYLNIAICDDNTQDCKILESLLHILCSSQKLDMHIDIFSCGEDFLASYRKNPYQIVFMDIYMTGINGIDTVKEICQPNNVQIIFTSTSREHALEAFGLNAAHYLLKPLTEVSAKEALDRCLLRLGQNTSRHLEIKTTQGIVPIPINNIVYIEVFNKISTIHTEKNSFQTYMSLNTLFDHLDDTSFMRAHRSFIVNMHFIESFFFDHIVLQGGKEIVLSRNNRTELKNQYQQFLFHLARRGEI